MSIFHLSFSDGSSIFYKFVGEGCLSVQYAVYDWKFISHHFCQQLQEFEAFHSSRICPTVLLLSVSRVALVVKMCVDLEVQAGLGSAAEDNHSLGC